MICYYARPMQMDGGAHSVLWSALLATLFVLLFAAQSLESPSGSHGEQGSSTPVTKQAPPAGTDRAVPGAPPAPAPTDTAPPASAPEPAPAPKPAPAPEPVEH
jgi:hypothetical protein